MMDEIHPTAERHAEFGDKIVAGHWKAEADTLRRIVLDALAEYDRLNDFRHASAGHWTNRARAAFGIEEE